MVGFAMVLPLIPFYATQLGATGFVVGILLAAFSIAQLLSASAWGRFSDRYGRRPAILTGLVISAVAYVVFAFADTLPLLLVSRFVQGVGGGTVGVLQAYVADAIDPDERAKSLGWLSAATSFGVVIGPAFGSVLTVLWGHSAPGLGAAALCVAICAFAWRFLRESRADGAVVPTSRRVSRQALVRVLSHAAEPAPRLIWIYALGIGAFYGTGQLMPLLLSQRFHVTEETVGYFFMYFGLMGVIIRAALLGPLVRRFKEARLARAGLIFLGAGLGLAAAARTYPTLFVAMTLMPLGTALLFPCVTALLARVVPAQERGLQMGVQQTYGGISRVAFPIITGLFIDRLGPGLPFAVGGLLVLLTLPLTSSLEEYLLPAAVP
jgi:multidrug resistance protein